ncbi:MAG: hypothetical protein GY847_01730 [Proteobacteria bacterium]|nr:hypothetical protein [Pseudomonadota bacterium]
MIGREKNSAGQELNCPEMRGKRNEWLRRGKGEERSGEEVLGKAGARKRGEMQWTGTEVIGNEPEKTGDEKPRNGNEAR